MGRLTQVVGHGGANLPADVRLVQSLLNDRGASPRLTVDGMCGKRTVNAITDFQANTVGMRSPDGRVDPGGRTIRALGSSTTPKPAAPGPAHRPTRADRPRGFVRSGVKETEMTTRILDAIAPSFADVRAEVISAYMNDEALFWKVNYHWEYLRWMVEHCLTLNVSSDVRQRLANVRASLDRVAPSPSSGYRTSPVGKPKDTSTMQQMTARHKVLRQVKAEFKTLTTSADLKSLSTRTPKSFDYAAAPVAHPGTSKHGSGYALDIAGDNNAVANICKRLGASLVFDEKSHVHVEFKNGVASPR